MSSLTALLTRLLREGKIDASDFIPPPDRPPGTTRVIPGETGPGPNPLVLQENLGVPSADIFETPGHNIRMTEKAAEEAREAVTGSPYQSQPVVDPLEGEMALNKILRTEEALTGASRRRRGPQGTGGPMSRGLRKGEEELNLTGDDRATADEIARIQAAVAAARGGPVGSGSHSWEETVRMKAAASAKKFVKESDRNAYIQDVHGRLKELTKGFDLRGKQEQGSIKSVMKDKGRELAQLSESARNTKVGSEDSKEYIRKIAVIDDWITGKSQPPVTPFSKAASATTDAEKIKRLKKLRTDPRRNYREGDDSPIKSAIVRRAIKNAPDREWYRNPENRK